MFITSSSSLTLLDVLQFSFKAIKVSCQKNKMRQYYKFTSIDFEILMDYPCLRSFKCSKEEDEYQKENLFQSILTCLVQIQEEWFYETYVSNNEEKNRLQEIMQLKFGITIIFDQE